MLHYLSCHLVFMPSFVIIKLHFFLTFYGHEKFWLGHGKCDIHAFHPNQTRYYPEPIVLSASVFYVSLLKTLQRTEKESKLRIDNTQKEARINVKNICTLQDK